MTTPSINCPTCGTLIHADEHCPKCSINQPDCLAPTGDLVRIGTPLNVHGHVFHHYRIGCEYYEHNETCNTWIKFKKLNP